MTTDIRLQYKPYELIHSPIKVRNLLKEGWVAIQLEHVSAYEWRKIKKFRDEHSWNCYITPRREKSYDILLEHYYKDQSLVIVVRNEYWKHVFENYMNSMPERNGVLALPASSASSINACLSRIISDTSYKLLRGRNYHYVITYGVKNVPIWNLNDKDINEVIISHDMTDTELMKFKLAM